MSILAKTTEALGKVGLAAGTPTKSFRERADVLWRVALGGSALAVLRFGSGSSYHGLPVCAFLWLTGRPCPLCGMTRALACLTKGEWVRAIQFNLLSPLVFGILLATIGSAVLQFLAIEIRCPADFGLKRENRWTACLALFATYGVLRIAYLVP